MKSLSGRSLFTGVWLGLLNVALLAAIVVFLSNGTQIDSLKKTAAKRIELPDAAHDFPPLNTEFTILRTRALFYSSREYYVAPNPAMQDPILPKPNYKLTGTLTVPDKSVIALLSPMDGGVTRKVQEGDVLDGWTIKSVTSSKVVISMGARTEEIAGSEAKQAVGGLTRQPLALAQPQESTGVRLLGAGGGGGASIAPVISEARLYRPPPQ